MRLVDLTNFLETHAPIALQESYDNCGLLVGDPLSEIGSVLVSLDVTEQVVEEAIQLGANVIIAHHPIIFSGLKSITGSSMVERTIILAIKNNISIYAIHTNLDKTLDQGVNTKIADKLNLVQKVALRDEGLLEDKPVGLGIVGLLPRPMQVFEFLQYVKTQLHTNVIKYTPFDHIIEKVAICGGSGSFLLKDAIAAEAQAFITSDFKYHDYFESDGRLMITDIGHFESEQFTIELLYEMISEKFSNFAVYSTEVCTNPIKYF